MVSLVTLIEKFKKKNLKKRFREKKMRKKKNLQVR